MSRLPPSVEVPRGGQPALDDDLTRAGDIAARDDRIAPPTLADDLDRAVAGEFVGRLEAYAGDLGAHGVGRDVGERGDPLRDPAGRLRVEADDDVGQVGRARGPVEAEPEAVRDDERRHQHRRGERDPEPGQERAAAPDAHAVTGLSERGRQADSLIGASSGASRPSRRCSTRSAIAAASGSCVTITTARRVRLRSSASTVAPFS